MACVIQLSCSWSLFSSPLLQVAVSSGGWLCDLVNGLPCSVFSLDQLIEAQKVDVWEDRDVRAFMSQALSLVPAGWWHSLSEGYSLSQDGPCFCLWVLLTAPLPSSSVQEVVRVLSTARSFDSSTSCPKLCQGLFVNLSQMILRWICHLFPAGTLTDRVES